LDHTAEERDRSPSTTLYAIAIVAGRFGVDATYEHLNRSYVFAGAEPSTNAVIAIARDFGLHARRAILSWHELPRLRNVLPAILRLKDGTSLVLENIQEHASMGTVMVLRDPTASPDAVVLVDESRLRDVWGGEIILVKKRYGLHDEERPFSVMWLFEQVLQERRLFLDIGAASLVNTIFALAPAFLFMIVIDRVLVNRSYATLTVLTAAILVMISFEVTLSYIRRLFVEVATTRIDGRLNLYIFEKLLKLPMDYFEKNPTGVILSKLSQIGKIRHFLTGQLFGVILEAIPLLALIPLMLYLEWHLSLLVFGLTGIIFLIILAFIRPLNKRYSRVVMAEQRKGSHLVESIYGMRTIKSLALEGRRRHEWDQRVAQASSASYDLGALANYPQTMTLPFERLIYSGTFLVGAYMALTNPTTVSIGVLVAFTMLSTRLAQPLVLVARLLQEVAEVRGAIGEVASVMNAPPEQGHHGTGLRLPIEGEISFQDVKFRYGPVAPPALDGVSFTIPRGTIFGIMGRSGSGKTTVTRLLQGLNPGYEGIIKIDGMDLREIDLTHLRTNIGVVPQENFLFSGTIRENIAMARPDAGFAEIVRVAQMAGAEEFIERLPRGYETMLEEGAANLSGGQRQRLAIARALLIDPPVLILDEATSALDAESEAIINANLQRMARDRTIICISHRLSMLVPAHAILVLERGKVYDIGTHDELLHRCDIYKHLWHVQHRNVERSTPHVKFAIARAPEA
jgi:ATP-binding cassette, subfamily B, bacterial HlyB/CyaB